MLLYLQSLIVSLQYKYPKLFRIIQVAFGLFWNIYYLYKKNMENKRLEDAYNQLVANKVVSSKGEFAEMLGYNGTYVSELFSGSNPISKPFLDKLQSKFGINKDWIKTGEGEMFKENSKTTPKDYTKTTQPSGKIGKWMHDMRNEFYKKVYDKKYPKTAIEIEIEMLREELDNMEELLRKEKEGQ